MSMREKITLAIANVDDSSDVILGRGAFTNSEWKGFEKITDAILDALMELTWEMEGAGIQTDEIDSIDWVAALMDTGITSAQAVVVASYKAMIKAAKEGK